MSKPVFFAYGFVLLLIVSVVCGGSEDGSSSRNSAPPPPTASAPQIEMVGTRVDVNLEDPAKSGKYLYDPGEFTFKTDEEVTFVFTSEGEFHTFTVKDLDIDVAVDANATESLTFKFDQPGTYEVICIPHTALGMKGQITVQ